MAWSIEFDPEARRELEKLDKPVSDRILKFLRERVAPLDDPRSIGGRLHAPLRQYWKHRIGDSCLIGSLKEDPLVMLVVRLDHRRERYKR
ncbi:MAG: type II toxin-antitoxin system RelE/ParE family toxin [Candidatus Sulfotelmatobacter sp.]|jgi:mRNA interferase RelE/StbE